MLLSVSDPSGLQRLYRAPIDGAAAPVQIADSGVPGDPELLGLGVLALAQEAQDLGQCLVRVGAVGRIDRAGPLSRTAGALASLGAA